jgi:hypothetical protein
MYIELMTDQSERPSYYEQNQSRIEKAKEKRSRPYIESIAEVRTKDEVIQKKQLEILKEMPDYKNLSRLLKAGLKANRVENPGNDLPDKLIIQGILFEELVKIENGLYDLSTDGSVLKQAQEKFDDLEKGKTEAGLDEQLTTLFHNPDRFNYSEISHLRNPDLSFVETDADGKTLTVVGVGEAKSSLKLDERCLLQFKYFHRNLDKVANFINSRSDCEEHGLNHFGTGEDKTFLNVNSEENFDQYLIVTSDMKIDKENPRSGFKMVGEGALSEQNAQIFEKMIKEGKIIIKKSSFSHQELEQLAAKAEQIIAHDMRIEMQEYLAEQEAV